MCHLLHTLVRVFEVYAETDVTFGTMEEILTTIHSADATLVTVELLLVFVVKETTDGAEVPTELHPTRHTTATHRLCRVAHETDDLRDGVTVDLVGFDLIMTNPTWVDFLAARRNVSASPLVMDTSVFLGVCGVIGLVQLRDNIWHIGHDIQLLTSNHVRQTSSSFVR